jgi:hypothetical protein
MLAPTPNWDEIIPHIFRRPPFQARRPATQVDLRGRRMGRDCHSVATTRLRELRAEPG